MTQKCPCNFKSATLKPLYRDGNKSLLSNYHLINILPVIGKILEIAVHNQGYGYLCHNKTLLYAQFGYREDYSTSACDLNLTDTIFHNMGNGMLTGVTLDLNKAVNPVDREILLQYNNNNNNN